MIASQVPGVGTRKAKAERVEREGRTHPSDKDLYAGAPECRKVDSPWWEAREFTSRADAIARAAGGGEQP